MTGSGQLSGKIIYIVSIFYPPEKGAASSRIAKMAEGLASQGADVEVITALPNYPHGKIYPEYRRRIIFSETINGIKVNRYWLYPSNSKSAFPRILNMLSFAASIFLCVPNLWIKRPDVMIINTPPLLVGLSGIILSKLCGAKTILNVSDIWPLSALELGAIKKGRFYSLLESIEKFLYRSSEKITVQSGEIAAHIKSINNKTPIMLYRNLDPTSQLIEISPPTRDIKVKLIYAGLLGIAQGVLEICENVNFHELNAELHIYGNGNEYEQIQYFIASNPGCNIFLHSMINKEEIPLLLSGYHATLIPLKTPIYGAFPSKIYMAISAGLPIIFTGAGEGGEMVRRFNIGWAGAPADYQFITQSIIDLHKMNNEQYMSLRKRVCDIALGEFNIDQQMTSLVDFIAN